MSSVEWDAAVIGGGPAGCSAAITLARRGLKVVLFEAKTYPHDKMCGEFLSPECSGLLSRLGVLGRLQEFGPVAIHTACLTSGDGNAWESRLPGDAMGISRKILDAVLVEQARCAGVQVCEASPVTGLAGSLAEGFTLEVESRPGGMGSSLSVSSSPGSRAPYVTRSVIAAHGKRSMLDRSLNRKFLKRAHPFVAIKAHFHGPAIPGRIELHAFPGGYCGLSEIEGGAKVVCLLVEEQVLKAHRGKGAEGVDGFVDWMQRQNLYLRTWMQWAERIHPRWISIAQVPFELKPVVERDVLMAGDAAGLIAPLAGNGIAMALSGGMLAAENLAGYLNGEVTGQKLRWNYTTAWKKRFGLRLRLSRALQLLMIHPQSASLALKLLNYFPGLGRYLIAHTRETAL